MRVASAHDHKTSTKLEERTFRGLRGVVWFERALSQGQGYPLKALFCPFFTGDLAK